MAFALALAPAAYGTTVTVQLSGTWDAVSDTAGVLDGSIAAGGAWSATLVYDDAAPDLNPSASTGDYTIPAASFDLTFQSGSYTFSLGPAESGEISVDNGVGGRDTLILYAENFALAGPVAPGIALGFGYVNPGLSDSTQTAHSSDALTGLPWDIDAYNSTDFYFFAGIGSTSDYIELDGPITSLTLVPEPTTALLDGLGLAALAAFARRRARKR